MREQDCKPPANDFAVWKSFKKLALRWLGQSGSRQHLRSAGTDRYISSVMGRPLNLLMGIAIDSLINAMDYRPILISEDPMRGIANQTIFLAAFILAMAAGKAIAQSSGQQDFMRDCAECHGTDGKEAQAEKRAAPGYISVDLTQISKQHGGEFPRQQVYDAIDGSHRIAAHFRGDMPRWAGRYKIDEKDQSGAGQRVHQRISALVDFIQSIQEK